MGEATETPEGRRFRTPLATLEQRVVSALRSAGGTLTDVALAGRLRVTLHAVAQACADLAAIGRLGRDESDPDGPVNSLR